MTIMQKVHVSPTAHATGSLSIFTDDEFPVSRDAVHKNADIVNMELNTQTDWHVMTTSDYGMLVSGELRWIQLDSTNEISRGDMFMPNKDSRMRFIIVDSNESLGYLVKVIDTIPGETAVVSITDNMVWRFVQEPLPIEAPAEMSPVVRTKRVTNRMRYDKSKTCPCNKPPNPPRKSKKQPKPKSQTKTSSFYI
jgi:hypothetical protein